MCSRRTCSSFAACSSTWGPPIGRDRVFPAVSLKEGRAMQLFRIEPAGAHSQARSLHFGPHRLAGPHGPLSSNGVDVKLRPKALAVLWTLASEPGRVHTKS